MTPKELVLITYQGLRTEVCDNVLTPGMTADVAALLTLAAMVERLNRTLQEGVEQSDGR